MIAWQIDLVGFPRPVVDGAIVTDRWAVLLPNGVVICDWYLSCTGVYKPLPLQAWITSEIEYMELAHLDLDLNDPAIETT